MLKWFIHPGTGERLPVADCLARGLLSEHYPRPYLEMCARERPWTGQPSITQLIAGTREAWLKLTTDYALDPQDQAFAIVGTKGHSKLEGNAGRVGFAEERLVKDDVAGIVDLLEQQPDGSWWLIDYKTSGSYKVARALGLVSVDVPLTDESGQPVLLKSGPRKGQPKTHKVTERHPELADLRDWTLQLNGYRLAAEAALGEAIAQMRVFAIVRDGGTYIATSRGVSRKVYYFDIPKLPDAEVSGYFAAKRGALLAALDGGGTPAPCSPEEAWDGKKCSEYCVVREACAALGCPYLGALGEETAEAATEEARV